MRVAVITGLMVSRPICASTGPVAPPVLVAVQKYEVTGWSISTSTGGAPGQVDR